MKLLPYISLLALTSGEVVRVTNYIAPTLVKRVDPIQTTAVTSCHFHDNVQFCIDGHRNEGSMVPAPTDKANVPTEYTGCHSHGSEVFCLHNGKEIEFIKLDEADHDDDHDHESHDHNHEDHDHVTSHDHDHEPATTTAQTTAVTSCHFHDTVQYCIDGQGKEGSIVPAPTNTASAPTKYTGCHSHKNEVFCLYNGKEVEFVKLDDAGDHNHEETEKSGKKCHFHAGVEHCVDDGEEKSVQCDRVDRDYNIRLRIGLLFVILVTSAIGAFGPMFLKKMFNLDLEGMIITIIKQFGTGIIISTAFVHLMTHADLMWSNACLADKIHYEATGTALTMAGIFVAFVIEFIANRALKSRAAKTQQQVQDTEVSRDTKEVSDQTSIVSSSSPSLISLHGISSKDKISVVIMEAGIVFHSVLIGITLVVAGDAYFITLFIVIVFHQFFEGLALGSRIVGLKNTALMTKLIMALVFALITPIGMAIGIGTLKTFNGNDPSTLIALATLDSFSAGVLLWTGLIEMWSQDWLHGYLSNAPITKTIFAMLALVAGLILMSLLGNWA